jgi:hypothetical protein
VFVDTMGIASTDFGLTTDQRDKLFANGQAAAGKFLAAWTEAHPPVPTGTGGDIAVIGQNSSARGPASIPVR